jgi:hypothetical protein
MWRMGGRRPGIDCAPCTHQHAHAEGDQKQRPDHLGVEDDDVQIVEQQERADKRDGAAPNVAGRRLAIHDARHAVGDQQDRPVLPKVMKPDDPDCPAAAGTRWPPRWRRRKSRGCRGGDTGRRAMRSSQRARRASCFCSQRCRFSSQRSVSMLRAYQRTRTFEPRSANGGWESANGGRIRRSMEPYEQEQWKELDRRLAEAEKKLLGHGQFGAGWHPDGGQPADADRCFDRFRRQALLAIAAARGEHDQKFAQLAEVQKRTDEKLAHLADSIQKLVDSWKWRQRRALSPHESTCQKQA